MHDNYHDKDLEGQRKAIIISSHHRQKPILQGSRISVCPFAMPPRIWVDGWIPEEEVRLTVAYGKIDVLEAPDWSSVPWDAMLLI